LGKVEFRSSADEVVISDTRIFHIVGICPYFDLFPTFQNLPTFWIK
jgi:hypothetical protein